MSTEALSNVFGDRIISSDIWSARSPDLNPCGFFFWGYLKDKVYNSNRRTEEELHENIRKELANIQNLFRQCEECPRVEGQHFQHLL
jgi:hypothetical protein